MVILSNASFHMHFLVSVLNRHLPYLSKSMTPGTDLTEASREGRKGRHTSTEKLGSGGLGSQMGKPQDPGNSVCLLHMVK